ncbi:MAG: hypothetical protein Q9170_007313 [Blastenia crenularia]
MASRFSRLPSLPSSKWSTYSRRIPSFLWKHVKQQSSVAAKSATPVEIDELGNDLNANGDYFDYTRDRFICNETFEMAQRHVRFNMNELCQIAAKALAASSGPCIKVDKYPDGMHNKTFLFTLQDGAEVVVKVPNPNAGRPHFTTASEVATMDFMRNVLSSPIPKVLAWSSNADNPVGAEYVIMEKVAGIALDQVWPAMNVEDRFAVMKALFDCQKSWLSASFRDIGALYYAKDLPSSVSLDCVYATNGKETKDSRFVIGPCTGRNWVDNVRAAVHFDRGPWSSVEDYIAAIGHREIACIREVAELPKSPLTLCGPRSYIPTRHKKTAAVENYLKVFKYLLPTDESITKSYLWHGDLHTENILVDSEHPTQIVGLIDWQSTDLLPLYDHARQPYILDYDGPPVNGLERPILAEGHADPDERRRARILYHNMSLVALYRRLAKGQSKTLYRAMEFRDSMDFDLLSFAGYLLVDGEAQYQSLLVDLEEAWSDLPGVRAQENPRFPIKFSKEERAAIETDVVASDQGMKYMGLIKDKVGDDLWPINGIIRPEKYHEAKAALKKAKKELYDQLGLDDQERAEWDSRWPFDD